MLYPLEQTRDVLQFYRDFSLSGPDELTTQDRGVSAHWMARPLSVSPVVIPVRWKTARRCLRRCVGLARRSRTCSGR